MASKSAMIHPSGGKHENMLFAFAINDVAAQESRFHVVLVSLGISRTLNLISLPEMFYPRLGINLCYVC